MIDVNVFLDQWPFRRLPHDQTEILVRKLRDNGVTQAWAGSFDALLHRDIAGVNVRLNAACEQHGEGLLRPFGAVNPTLPDWREDLRRCHEDHKMPGIRLFPSYHGYKLDDPDFSALLESATERGLIVQLVWKMEDERMRNPLITVPALDPAPLLEQVTRLPKLRLILLNALRNLRGEPLGQLTASKRVWVDLAMLEGVGGVEALIPTIGAGAILFGSLSPLFVFESAMLKLKESSLTPEQLEAIRVGNAQRLIESR